MEPTLIYTMVYSGQSTVEVLVQLQVKEGLTPVSQPITLPIAEGSPLAKAVDQLQQAVLAAASAVLEGQVSTPAKKG